VYFKLHEAERPGFDSHERQGLICSGKCGRSMKLSTILPLVSRSGTRECCITTACIPSWSTRISQVQRNEDVSKSFRTGSRERELQMVQLSATKCSFIDILRVSLMRFATITLCVASQRVFIVVSVYFVIYSVRKLFGYTLIS
jgi:hypothetical protein